MGASGARPSTLSHSAAREFLDTPHVCWRPPSADLFNFVLLDPPLLAGFDGRCITASLTELRISHELRGAPAYIPLIGREIYLAMPGKQIEGLFRRSSSLVPTPSLFDALTIFFGLSGRDIHIFNHDRISAYEASVGFYTDHPDVSRRIMEHQRQDFAHYLQGRNLVFVMERFKKNLASELSAASEVGHDWGHIPDLFSFLSNIILKANVEALYGEHLLRICPTFCQDFWNFYKAFPNISKGLPRWLVPSSYQARDEMHKNFDRWRTWCSENYNWDNDGLRDIEYEPIWGTQYVRKMIQRHEALGLSNNGVAVVMLGYFFVYVHVHSLSRSTFALLFRHEGCRSEKRPRDRCLPNTVLWQTPFPQLCG